MSVSAQNQTVTRVLPLGTSLQSDGHEIQLKLAFSGPVAYRVLTLDTPRRLMVDFADIDFTFMPRDLAANTSQVSAVRFGVFQQGESRLILDLTEPFVLSSAIFEDGILSIILMRSSADQFALTASEQPPSRHKNKTADISGNAGLPLVALDAGHGGLDPGAIRGDIAEKRLTLLFALQLRDALLETGRYRVLMTRTDDTYLLLPERIRLARASQADIFLSLHANTVERGNARGTAVYNLSKEASDAEAASRAEIENRSDLVAGTVLSGQDDQIAQILVEMAQRETNAGSSQFADLLAAHFRAANDLTVPSRRLAADFRVLRAVDTPSVLVELGFMSNTTDLANLMSGIWRQGANEAIIAALDQWITIAR